MSSVSHEEHCDFYVWGVIQYLDPDLESPLKRATNKTETNTEQRSWLMMTLLPVAALAGALAMRYFPLLARFVN